jgi:hypothetical protein
MNGHSAPHTSEVTRNHRHVGIADCGGGVKLFDLHTEHYELSTKWLKLSGEQTHTDMVNKRHFHCRTEEVQGSFFN